MRTILIVWLLSLAACGERESPAPTDVAAPDKVLVFRSPTCGCYGNWAAWIREAGFSMIAMKVEDMQAVKTQRGIPPPLQSCHTAVVGGYVIEGHVPARAIRRLLDERPAAPGLTVPGMPAGSPWTSALDSMSC